MSRADDDLLAHIFTGLRIITEGFDEAIHGSRYGWESYERRQQRRRPRQEVTPAGSTDVVVPLLQRLETFARKQRMGDQTLLSTQEIADFLGLERVSVYNLMVCWHISETTVGNRKMASVAEIARYLREGPRYAARLRQEWRPLIDEFPKRAEMQERQAAKAAIREKYDAVFENDVHKELEIEWDRLDRYIERGTLPSFHVEETSWPLIKRSDVEDFKEYLKHEAVERAERRRQRQVEKQERRRL